jgi:predicted secreted protein
VLHEGIGIGNGGERLEREIHLGRRCRAESGGRRLEELLGCGGECKSGLLRNVIRAEVAGLVLVAMPFGVWVQMIGLGLAGVPRLAPTFGLSVVSWFQSRFGCLRCGA